MAHAHVQGAGTIGAPLVHLLTRYGTELGFDEVTFTKHTPRSRDRPRIERLRQAGARFVVDAAKKAEFEETGFTVDGTLEDTVEQATVVVEATPSGIARDRKPTYEQMDGPAGFLAQGSEAGFGTPYAAEVNDEILDAEEGRFTHIVSCNTHNIAALVRAVTGDEPTALERGSVVCIRRGTDVGQAGKAPMSPHLSIHDEAEGTHHAHDVVELYETLDVELDLFSSAIKVPTQFMHTIWFQLVLEESTDREAVLERIRDDPLVAVTDKMDADLVFNMGREFGPFGRILNQGVVATETLHVDEGTITGFCFTPQDGNALLSNVRAATRYAHPEDWRKRAQALDEHIVDEL